MNQEAKHDEGKLQISLCPTKIIEAITAVRMFGNAKYKEKDNWRTVEFERYVDAFWRHWLVFCRDPKHIDEESGLPTIWHCACNLAFIIELMEEGDENLAEKWVKSMMSEWKARYGND